MSGSGSDDLAVARSERGHTRYNRLYLVLGGANRPCLGRDGRQVSALAPIERLDESGWTTTDLRWGQEDTRGRCPRLAIVMICEDRQPFQDPATSLPIR